jgi:hypothetical protein
MKILAQIGACHLAGLGFDRSLELWQQLTQYQANLPPPGVLTSPQQDSQQYSDARRPGLQSPPPGAFLGQKAAVRPTRPKLAPAQAQQQKISGAHDGSGRGAKVLDLDAQSLDLQQQQQQLKVESKPSACHYAAAGKAKANEGMYQSRALARSFLVPSPAEQVQAHPGSQDAREFEEDLELRRRGLYSKKQEVQAQPSSTSQRSTSIDMLNIGQGNTMCSSGWSIPDAQHQPSLNRLNESALVDDSHDDACDSWSDCLQAVSMTRGSIPSPMERPASSKDRFVSETANMKSSVASTDEPPILNLTQQYSDDGRLSADSSTSEHKDVVHPEDKHDASMMNARSFSVVCSEEQHDASTMNARPSDVVHGKDNHHTSTTMNARPSSDFSVFVKNGFLEICEQGLQSSAGYMCRTHSLPDLARESSDEFPSDEFPYGSESSQKVLHVPELSGDSLPEVNQERASDSDTSSGNNIDADRKLMPSVESLASSGSLRGECVMKLVDLHSKPLACQEEQKPIKLVVKNTFLDVASNHAFESTMRTASATAPQLPSIFDDDDSSLSDGKSFTRCISE